MIGVQGNGEKALKATSLSLVVTAIVALVIGIAAVILGSISLSAAYGAIGGGALANIGMAGSWGMFASGLAIMVVFVILTVGSVSTYLCARRLGHGHAVPPPPPAGGGLPPVPPAIPVPPPAGGAIPPPPPFIPPPPAPVPAPAGVAIPPPPPVPVPAPAGGGVGGAYHPPAPIYHPPAPPRYQDEDEEEFTHVLIKQAGRSMRDAHALTTTYLDGLEEKSDVRIAIKEQLDFLPWFCYWVVKERPTTEEFEYFLIDYLKKNDVIMVKFVEAKELIYSLSKKFIKNIDRDGESILNKKDLDILVGKLTCLRAKFLGEKIKFENKDCAKNNDVCKFFSAIIRNFSHLISPDLMLTDELKSLDLDIVHISCLDGAEEEVTRLLEIIEGFKFMGVDHKVYVIYDNSPQPILDIGGSLHYDEREVGEPLRRGEEAPNGEPLTPETGYQPKVRIYRHNSDFFNPWSSIDINKAYARILNHADEEIKPLSVEISLMREALDECLGFFEEVEGEVEDIYNDLDGPEIQFFQRQVILKWLIKGRMPDANLALLINQEEDRLRIQQNLERAQLILKNLITLPTSKLFLYDYLTCLLANDALSEDQPKIRKEQDETSKQIADFRNQLQNLPEEEAFNNLIEAFPTLTEEEATIKVLDALKAELPKTSEEQEEQFADFTAQFTPLIYQNIITLIGCINGFAFFLDSKQEGREVQIGRVIQQIVTKIPVHIN